VRSGSDNHWNSDVVDHITVPLLLLQPQEFDATFLILAPLSLPLASQLGG
jgi:hypothetical protein